MIGFGIVTGLLFLLMAAVLELNKNTLLGFGLLLAATVGFVLLFCRVLQGARWYEKLLGHLGYVVVFALILFLTWPPIRAVPAYEGKAPVYTEPVRTRQGDVRGVVIADGAVELYAGIPYAQPPVGELRWKEPQDPLPWDGVLDGDHFAPMCMQPTHLPIYDSLARIIGYHDYRISLNDNYRPPVSEDGLYVNVWKPAGAVRDLPVLVYIHGPCKAGPGGGEPGLSAGGVRLFGRRGPGRGVASRHHGELRPSGPGQGPPMGAAERGRLRGRPRQRDFGRGERRGRQRQRPVHVAPLTGPVPPGHIGELHPGLPGAAPLLPQSGGGARLR